MCRYSGSRRGWVRPVGIGLILLGTLLLLRAVPPQLWAALLGILMILAGIALLRIG